MNGVSVKCRILIVMVNQAVPRKVGHSISCDLSLYYPATVHGYSGTLHCLYIGGYVGIYARE